MTKLNRYRKTITALERAISLEPQSAVVFNNLGCAYFHTGQLKKALKAFKQAISLNPVFSQAHFNLAMAYLKNGDRKFGLKQYAHLKTLDQELAAKFYQDLFSDKHLVVSVK